MRRNIWLLGERKEAKSKGFHVLSGRKIYLLLNYLLPRQKEKIAYRGKDTEVQFQEIEKALGHVPHPQQPLEHRAR